MEDIRQIERNENEKTTAQTTNRSKLQSIFHLQQLWGAGENPSEILRVMALGTTSQAGGSPSPTIAKQGSVCTTYVHK